MAKPYEEPKIDIVFFAGQDIITFSIGGGEGYEEDDPLNPGGQNSAGSNDA